MATLLRNLFLPFLFFACLACEMKQEVDIQLPPHEQELIVECYLEPGEPYRALITHTTSFYENSKLAAVDTADVSISSAEESRKLQGLNTADTNYIKVYNYWHPDEVNFEEGQEYQIKISVNGKVKATGKTRFLPKVAIEKIYTKHDKDSMAAVFVQFEDKPNEKNYYRMVLRGTNPKMAVTYDGIWSDENARNGSVLAYSPYVLKPGWSVVVNVYHIDKAYYEFIKSVKQARDANYNPFMQPASIQSTLEGATGVFTAVSLSSDTITVE